MVEHAGRCASLTEVAEATGYRSESAFSHAFKRATGTAPGQYRRVSEGGRLARRQARHLPDQRVTFTPHITGFIRDATELPLMPVEKAG
jgi:hypothetical protein